MVRNCKVCGTEFRTYPCKIKAGKGKYCSTECCLIVTGIKKGQHLSVGTEIKKGEKLRYTKGWRYTKPRTKGPVYKEIKMPDHPYCSKAGYVREHRLVMEAYLGRFITPKEIVHHIDGDGLNNSIDNLELMSVGDHGRIHLKDTVHKRWVQRGGVANVTG